MTVREFAITLVLCGAADSFVGFLFWLLQPKRTQTYAELRDE